MIRTRANEIWPTCAQIVYCTIAYSSLLQSSASPTTSPVTTTEFLPLDLCDLGYYEAGWDGFCDRKTIDEEFSYFPEHEVKRLRLLLCHLKAEREFDKKFRQASTVYKYCMTYKQRVDVFVEKLVEKFSMNDLEKKKELVAHFGHLKDTACFNSVKAKFGEKCIAPRNPYHSMFDDIFARACTYHELTTEGIISTIDEVCRGRFITDNLNYRPYYDRINFKSPPNDLHA